ncbi:MAG TPA: aspartate ammonia-lyase [Candidatus Polarisedimenticolia bacterium]|nr:aspartate ammonia-lyase [Candidatus Polarisedimenticolia bacterium]
MSATRIEKDSLGEKQVPADAYYGVQTVRALENFPISGLRAHPALITAHAFVKKAAALTNCDLGNLAPELSDAIVRAADELIRGDLRDQIVVDVFQAGAGVSFNMNCNEVLANRAAEILGGGRGEYKKVHPNDHVNMAQSTNDTFPTSMRLSSLLMLRDLLPVVEKLERSFAAKGREFDGIIKSGRTHLQDAVPVRLGQEFAAYAATLARCRERLAACGPSLAELGIGGTAAGTGINTHPEYRTRMTARLAELTGLPLRGSADLREAMQSQLPLAEISSALKILSLELIRIANDLRLLSSGPRTGFAEIRLPAVQPGSSIMPGKVNPVMPEVLNMVAFQVVGNDLTVSLAVQAGQLELNVMMPAMIYNVLQSMEILKNTLEVFRVRCVEGITADSERCGSYALESVGIATALNRHIGYAAAAEVAKESMRTGKSIYQIVVDHKLLEPEQLRKILDPTAMTEPGIPGES